MENRVIWPGGAYIDFSLNANGEPINAETNPAPANAPTNVLLPGPATPVPGGVLAHSMEFDPDHFLYISPGVRQFNPIGVEQGFDRFEWASVLSCSSDQPELYCCNLSIPNPLVGGARDDHVIQIFHRSPVNEGTTQAVGEPVVLTAPVNDGINVGPRCYVTLRRFARLSDVS